jgi:hypothetical protein
VCWSFLIEIWTWSSPNSAFQRPWTLYIPRNRKDW